MQGVHSESLEQSQFAAADGDAHDRSEPVTADACLMRSRYQLSRSSLETSDLANTFTRDDSCEDL